MLSNTNDVENNRKIKLGIIIAVIVAAIVIAGTVFFIAYNTPEQRIKRHLSLGEKYLAEMNYAEAILEFEKAIKIEPKTEAAYIGMAKAYTAQENYEEALKVVESAIEIIGETEELLSLKTDLENKLKPVETLSDDEDKKEEKTEDTPKVDVDWTFDLYDIWKYELFGKDINDWTQEELARYLIDNGLLDNKDELYGIWRSDRYGISYYENNAYGGPEIVCSNGKGDISITCKYGDDRMWQVDNPFLMYPQYDYDLEYEYYDFPHLPNISYSNFISMFPSEINEMLKTGQVVTFNGGSVSRSQDLSSDNNDNNRMGFYFYVFGDNNNVGYLIEFDQETGELALISKHIFENH